MTVLAIGPGLGLERDLVSRLLDESKTPCVIDADALNSIADRFFAAAAAKPC